MEKPWTLVDEEPHVRKDGGSMVLNVWKRSCKTCGQPFTVKVPLKSGPQFKVGYGGSKQFDLVNCERHRVPTKARSAST